MVDRGIFVLLIFLVFSAALPQRLRADAVVGTGAADSCTETALDTALAVGGTVTFNCGGAATIIVTSTKTISADTTTTIDGASVITISGGDSVPVFQVFSLKSSVKFTVQNVTIADGNNWSGSGGGIYNAGHTVTVMSTTFSGNRASYGSGCPFGRGA